MISVVKKALIPICVLQIAFTGLQDFVPHPPLALVPVKTDARERLVKQYLTEREKRLGRLSENPSYVSVSIRMTDQALISRPHPWTTTTVINATVTTQPPVERRVFSDNAVPHASALFVNSTDPREAVSFFLDPIWNRVVFGQKSGDWLRSYGESNGPPRNEYRLAGPRAMAVDLVPNNEIYIADTENGRIVKLKYIVDELVNAASYSIPGISHPVDICLPCQGDYLWVADDWSGKIAMITRTGDLLQSITSYTIAGQTYPLDRPRAVNRKISNYAQRLAFVDGRRNAFVVCTLNAQNLITPISATEFNQPGSRLTSIGADLNENWYVADPGLGMIHSFDFAGEYLASLSRPDLPPKISTPPCFIEGGNLMEAFEVYTSEQWSNTKGLRAFLPGADAVDRNVQENATQFLLNSVVTNGCNLRVKIVKASDGSLVQTIHTGSMFASTRQDVVEKSTLPFGQYKFRIEVEPIYNANYGDFAVPWLVKDVAFSYLPAAPQNVIAVGHPSNVILTWNTIAGVDGYHVYRSTSSSGPFSLVATLPSTSVSCVDPVPNPPGTYYYFVKGYVGNDEGPQSTTVSAQTLHLATTSSNATGSTSQRKVIRDTNGRLHFAYESGNQIWYTWSSDGGSNWQPEQLVSNVAGLELHRSPSITVQYTPHLVILVWEAYLGDDSDHAVVTRTIDPVTSALGVTESIAQLGPHDSTHFSTMPVVGYGSAGGGYVLCAWYDSLAEKLRGSVRECVTGEWSQSVDLVSAAVQSIALAPGTNGAQKWHLSWTQGTSLNFRAMNVSPNLTLGSGEVVTTLGTYWYFEGPSVVGLGGQYNATGIAWREYSDEFINMYVKYRERSSSGTWGTTVVWTGNLPSTWLYTPTITAQYASSYPGIVWRKGVDQLQFTRKIGTIWVKPGTIGTGIAPSTGTSFVFDASEPVMYRGSTAPYPISKINAGFNVALAKGEEPRLDPTSSTLPEGRGGVMKFDDGIAYVAIMQAKRDTVPISFSFIKDTARIGDLNDFMANAVSQRFSSGGTLHLRVRYGAHGNVPTNLRFRIVLRDAQNGEQLALIRSLIARRDTVVVVSVPLTYSSPQIKLCMEPIGNDKPVRYEIERWFVIPEDGDNAPLISGLMQKDETVPVEYVLHPNYPNPFNPTTEIRFDLPEPSAIRLLVYDMLGREVEVLADGIHNAGYHSITWNAQGKSSGVYFVRFVAKGTNGGEEYSKLQKVVLMK